MFNCLKSIALGCLLVAPFCAKADHDFEFSGYATLGLSYENEDDLGFFRTNTQNKRPDSDLSFAPDSQVGLQVSYRLNSKWHATTQFVLADKLDYDLDSVAEWAFIGYSPLPGLDIRVGRVAVDIFDLSEIRRVDYASLWVRPPRELYGWIIPYSIDGLDVAKSFYIGSTYLRAKLQYGSTDPKIESPDGSRQFQSEFNDLVSFSLAGEYGAWSARLSHAQFTTAKVEGETRELFDVIQLIGGTPEPVIPSAIAQDARHLYHHLDHTSEAKVKYYQFGLGYDDGVRVFNAEVARLSTESCVVPTGNAGYVSFGYRVGDFTPYMVYSGFEPDKGVVTSSADWSVLPGGEEVKGAALSILNSSLIDQYTFSAGLRWDFASGFALKGQWDHTTIREHSYGLWAFDNDRQRVDSVVNVLSLSLNSIF